MNLRGLLNQTVTVEFHGVSEDLFKLLTGPDLLTETPKSDAEVVAEVHSLLAAAAPDVQFGTAAIQAALYQDDDAHDTCSLTACLNPLHPGPCKGWKGTLHNVSPGAWHALEAARVEKANHARVKKIEALKAQGKPIPHKLLQPILPKAQPNAGQTAKNATGEAHAAGKAISDSAGIVNNHPGKVSLGQAVKSMGPVEKGPKGKKPSVMSKGIAFVIAQDKVTPQYKLDKAAQITPEQWNTLNPPDKAIVRAELAKIKTEGFGPQQKKATELLDKLPAGAPAKPSLTVKEAKANGTLKESADKVAEQAKGQLPKVAEMHEPGKTPTLVTPEASGSKKGVSDQNGILVKPSGFGPVATTTVGLPSGYKLSKDKGGYTLTYKGKIIRTSAEQKALEDYAEKHHNAVAFILAKHKAAGTPEVNANFEVSKLTPEKVAEAGSHKAPTKLSEVATPDTAVTTGGKPKLGGSNLAAPSTKVQPSVTEKPKALPKHVEAAIAMAKGHAPGASWSKNHLAAYQPLTAEEFHGLPKDVQDTIVSELTKGQSKFLDPKKVAAAKALLEKFKGAPGVPKAEAPKAEIKAVSFVQDLHNHAISDAEAKKSVAGTPIGTQFLAAKQIAGLTDADNPDATSLHTKAANEDASALVKKHTALYAGAVMSDPGVKAAQDKLRQAAWDQSFAQSVLSAKQKAFSKIAMKTKGDHGLSPMEKATLTSVGKHMLEHDNPPTDVPTMDKLKADTKTAEQELDHVLQAALKKANAPSPADMSPAQIEDRAKELLGPIAVDPSVSLPLAQTQHFTKLAKAQAQQDADTYPSAVLEDPAVSAKYAAYVSAIAQLNFTNAMQAKLDYHLKVTHQEPLDEGVDQDGNPLTAEDKKIIGLHAAKLQADHSFLVTAKAANEQKVTEAKAVFHAAADKVKATPAEPIKLSDYDKTTVSGVYSNAWNKHAEKAVTFGVKSYAETQKMKAHAQYPSLVMDLKDLKGLAGNLALAHAEEHTAQLNVPTDPDTGALEKGPEYTAWLAAMAKREDMTSQFNVLHKTAQARLDAIRVDMGLKKRALPKLDASSVKTSAAESAYFKTGGGFKGPNYGKPAKAKGYLLAKAGPKIAVSHKTASDKAAEKLGGTTAPTVSTVKIENVPSGEPIPVGAPDSSISHIPDAVKKQVTADFKAMPDGKYLADPAQDIFSNLVTLAAVHGTPAAPLSVDQVLKTIDETHSKNLGVGNSGMLHKKITEWLGTPEGKAYAQGHSVPDAKKVKQLKGELDLPEGVTLEPGEKVQKLAGPGPHDTSLSSSAFKAATAEQAQAAQDANMKATGVKWTAKQKQALKSYTGSAYSTYNGYLRGNGSGSASVKQDIIDIQSAMMPLPQHTLLKRGTGWPPEMAAFKGDPSKLVGKTFQEPGFTSTTVAGSGGHFSGQPLQLVIEAPAGTPAAFVNGISHYKNQENEMLLAAGTKFKVLSVEKTTAGHTLMRVRIVGDK